MPRISSISTAREARKTTTAALAGAETGFARRPTDRRPGEAVLERLRVIERRIVSRRRRLRPLRVARPSTFLQERAGLGTGAWECVTRALPRPPATTPASAARIGHQPPRAASGSVGLPARRTSKCRRLPLQRPVHPTVPITWPCWTATPVPISKLDVCHRAAAVDTAALAFSASTAAANACCVPAPRCRRSRRRPGSELTIRAVASGRI